jgi:hypothetical protein
MLPVLFPLALLPLALMVEQVPMLLFGLPLIAAASLVFAATHHEAAEAIKWAALEWAVWLVGILGVVMVVVLVISSL